MIKYLCLAVGLVFATTETAKACSPSFPRCHETGRCPSDYRTPKWIKQTDLRKNFDIIAVVSAQVSSETIESKNPRNRKKVTAEFTTLKPIKGTPAANFEIKWVAEGKASDTDWRQHPERRFGLWDHMDLWPKSYLDYGSASCSTRIKNKFQSDQTYLVFLNGTGPEYFLQDAILLSSEEDALIEDIEAIVQDRPDAPNRMDAKTYLQNMTGFAELTIKTCPTTEELRYTDSRFANAKGQHNTAYEINTSLNYDTPVIDIRDIGSYVNEKIQTEKLDYFRRARRELSQKSLSSKDDYSTKLGRRIDEYSKNHPSFTCQPQSQYFAIFRQPKNRRSFRYLPIENGVVDLNQLITNIQLTGPKKINIYDIKSWIKEANPED